MRAFPPLCTGSGRRFEAAIGVFRIADADRACRGDPEFDAQRRSNL
jgi:hypothetical protein